MLLVTPLVKVDGAYLRRKSLGSADQLSVKESTTPDSPISSGRRLRNGGGCVPGQFHISIEVDEPNSCSNSDVYPVEWDHPKVAPFIFYDTAAACCERVIQKAGKCRVINACADDAEVVSATPIEIYSEPSCGKTIWRPSTTELYVCTNSDEGYPVNFPYVYFSAEQCCKKSPWADESTPCQVVDVCATDSPTTQPSSGSAVGVKSWYVHPKTNQCAQDCVKERGTYCGGEIPSWSTPFDTVDLCCDSISWKPRDECVVNTETLDPESGSAVRSWYVHSATNQCVQDCVKERGTYCGGAIPSWSTPFETVDLCCDSISWKPRDECVVEIKTFDPTSGSDDTSWYVHPATNECVQDCVKERGTYCGGAIPSWSTPFETADLCCDSISWKPRDECVVKRETLAPTSQPTEGMSAVPSTSPTDEPKYAWYMRDSDQVCVQNCETDQGFACGGIVNKIVNGVVNQYKATYRSAAECCKSVPGKTFEECRPSSSRLAPTFEVVNNDSSNFSSIAQRPAPREINCPSQLWYLHRLGSQSLCVNDLNYDDGTYDSSSRYFRKFHSSKTCCDRSVAGKKCEVVDVCDDAHADSYFPNEGLDRWWADESNGWDHGTCVKRLPIPKSARTWGSQTKCCTKAFPGQRSGNCIANLEP